MLPWRNKYKVWTFWEKSVLFLPCFRKALPRRRFFFAGIKCSHRSIYGVVSLVTLCMLYTSVHMHVHGAVLWYISLHAFLPMMVEQIWDMGCLAHTCSSDPTLIKFYTLQYWVAECIVEGVIVLLRLSVRTSIALRSRTMCLVTKSAWPEVGPHEKEGWLWKQAARYLTFVVMRRCSHWWRKAPDSSVHCTCFVYDVCMCCVVSKLKITSYKVPPGVNRHRRDYVCVCVPWLDAIRIF